MRAYVKGSRSHATPSEFTTGMGNAWAAGWRPERGAVTTLWCVAGCGASISVRDPGETHSFCCIACRRSASRHLSRRAQAMSRLKGEGHE